ncbi:MAG: hypothetical protein GY771_03105 [bacterium]|nr:hypothetical protein [bacterium]
MNKGLICLLLNLLTPGYGSFVAGDTSNGFWQLGLWYVGLILFLIGIYASYITFFISLILSFVGLIPLAIAYVWALVDGFKYIDSLPGNLTNGNLALILNLYVPGIGTIIFGDKDNGIWQTVLFYGGTALIFIGLGIFVMPVGKIWALIDGLRFNDTLTDEI